MSELSKQALQVENNVSFPNNATGYITPTLLRGFNSDLIDSTVNQTGYTTDSGSWNVSISQLNTFTSSQQPTFNALNVFTASQLNINSGYNSFTQSAGAELDSLSAWTGSWNDWTSSLNRIYDDGVLQGVSTRFFFNGLVSASVVQNVDGAIANVTIQQDGTKLNTASFNAYTASNQSAFNSFSSSTDNRLDSLESFSSSLDTNFVSETEFAVYTASVNSAIQVLSDNTGSYAITGSNVFNGNQAIIGQMSASADIFGLGVNVGDNGYLRFNSGSSNYYNVQLNPVTGDLAFSRDGVSNVKVLQLGGTSQSTSSFRNNPVTFENDVPNVQFNSTAFTVSTAQPRFTAGLQVTGAVNLQSDMTLLETTGTTALLLGPYATVGDGTGVRILRNNSNRNSNIQIYASSSAFVAVNASGSGYYNALDIKASPTGSAISDYNGTAYTATITFPANIAASNPAPIFPRGIEVSGSLKALNTIVSGSVTITGSVYGNVTPITPVSSTASIDLSVANYFTLTLGGTTRINVINPRPGVTATLVINTDTLASASFSSNVKQPSGSLYVASPSGNVDIISFTAVDSNTVYAFPAQSFV